MKKTATILSLAMLSSLSLSASDTLSDSFKNGTTHGEVKAIYYDVNKGAKGQGSILSLGAMLNYVSNPFYGLSVGGTFQSSNSPWADAHDQDFFKGDLYGKGAVLEEGYLKYQYGKSNIKAGRQFIKTPLLAGSGSRVIHEAFSGYTADIKEIADTRIFVAYVNEYLRRTDGLGNVGKFDKSIYMDGAGYAYNMNDLWTVLVQNKSIDGLTVTGQYLKVQDATKNGADMGDISIDMAQAEYKYDYSDLGFVAGLQYGSSKIDQDDSKSGDIIGAKFGARYQELQATLGYVVDNSDKDMVAGVGVMGTAFAYAGDMLGVVRAYNHDVNVASLDLKYNFKQLGMKNLAIQGRYTNFNTGSKATLNGGKDFNAYNFVMKYAFAGQLKGLSTKFYYEDAAKDANKDSQNYRFYLSYKF